MTNTLLKPGAQNSRARPKPRVINSAESNKDNGSELETATGRKRVALGNIRVPRKQRNMGALRNSLRLLDAVTVGAIIMAIIWNAYIGANGKIFAAPIAAGLLGVTAFNVLLLVMRAHRFAPAETYFDHLRIVTLACLGAMGIWLATAMIAKPATFAPDALATAGVMASLALMALHSFYYARIRRLHKKDQLRPTIVMLGATESARRMIEENARSKDLNIVAIFDERLARAPHNIHGVPVVGSISDLLSWDALPYIDRIVVTLPSMAQDRKADFIAKIRLLPNRIAFVQDEFETLDHVGQRLTQIAEISLREVTGKPKSSWHTLAKRAMDIIVSGAALTLGAPLLGLIALLIKLDSPGPVIFKQPRHGFNNRVFDVYKFRSMRNDKADKDARQQTQAGDTRVTKIGRFIRKTSIDELPQLLNVLKGDMSLVGPRPHAIGMHTGDVETYKLVEDYAHRHKVKPGMTGWAQINGSRGPLHDAESVGRRIRLDVEYIERASIWFDIVIMAKTLPCLLGDSENIR